MPKQLINYLSTFYKWRTQNKSVQKIDSSVYFLDTDLKETSYFRIPTGHPDLCLPIPCSGSG